MDILEDFYYTCIEPKPRSAAYHREAREVYELYERNKEKLLATLTDEQKERFQKFEDCLNEWRVIDDRCSFLTGFRAGARMITEALADEI